MAGFYHCDCVRPLCGGSHICESRQKSGISRNPVGPDWWTWLAAAINGFQDIWLSITRGVSSKKKKHFYYFQKNCLCIVRLKKFPSIKHVKVKHSVKLKSHCAQGLWKCIMLFTKLLLFLVILVCVFTVILGNKSLQIWKIKMLKLAAG